MSFTKAFPPALRELRIICCQSSAASAGTREFILARYATIKQHNPDLPVLIREASGVPARIFARFERGLEKNIAVDNMAAKDVESKFVELVGS